MRKTRGRRARAFSWRERLNRLVRYRLVVPLKRSHHHPPEHTARGVLVGLGWALTPTMGIHMVLCLITWIVARRLFRWEFNLIIACAWTWTINVVTMLPYYYLLYVTGQVMLGHFRHLSGYSEFLGIWHDNVASAGEAGNFDWLGYFEQLAVGWGLPLLVGCVPWVIAGAGLGYRWSLRFVRRHREARHGRRQAARQLPTPHAAHPQHAHPHGAAIAHGHEPPHRHPRAPGAGRSNEGE